MAKEGSTPGWFGEPRPATGIMSRRIFLESALIAGAAGTAVTAAKAEPLAVPAWSKQPGSTFVPTASPRSSRARSCAPMPAPPTHPHRVRAHAASAPRCGMMTPSGLHFERSHSGIPDIDPEQHPSRHPRHGAPPAGVLAGEPSRYPRTSRIAFLECAGNSGALNQAAAGPGRHPGHPRPVVVLGLDRRQALDAARRGRRRFRAATWVIAEGADSSGMSRSFPIAKAMDDALICLYQNRRTCAAVEPADPVRLLLPGLRRQHEREVAAPAQAHQQAADGQGRDLKIHDPLQNEKAWQFAFPLEVKSMITTRRPAIC